MNENYYSLSKVTLVFNVFNVLFVRVSSKVS